MFFSFHYCFKLIELSLRSWRKANLFFFFPPQLLIMAMCVNMRTRVQTLLFSMKQMGCCVINEVLSLYNKYKKTDEFKVGSLLNNIR